MLRNNAIGRRLRTIGETDARSGKPIEAFFDIPKIRHTEGMRASYEIGYRAAKAEMLKVCQHTQTDMPNRSEGDYSVKCLTCNQWIEFD